MVIKKLEVFVSWNNFCIEAGIVKEIFNDVDIDTEMLNTLFDVSQCGLKNIFKRMDEFIKNLQIDLTSSCIHSLPGNSSYSCPIPNLSWYSTYH